MNILHSSFKTLFARDMVIKMNYGSCLDLAKVKKATLQYTSKYVTPPFLSDYITSTIIYMTKSLYLLGNFIGLPYRDVRRGSDVTLFVDRPLVTDS